MLHMLMHVPINVPQTVGVWYMINPSCNCPAPSPCSSSRIYPHQHLTHPGPCNYHTLCMQQGSHNLKQMKITMMVLTKQLHTNVNYYTTDKDHQLPNSQDYDTGPEVASHAVPVCHHLLQTAYFSGVYPSTLTSCIEMMRSITVIILIV